MRFEQELPHHTEQIQHLLSTNLISRPARIVTFNDEPKFPSYVCCPKDPSMAKEDKYWGTGISVSHGIAKIKSMGESIERAALFLPRNPLARTARFSEMPNALNPALLAGFSDKQLGGNKESYYESLERCRFSWTEGTALTIDQKVWVPEQIVYLNGGFASETPLREQNTNGAAFGIDFDSAALRGLMEVVERDAFMISYLTAHPPPKIDVSSSEKLEELREYLQRYKLDLSLFDMTSDLRVPVTMAVALDRTGAGPAINIGMSADLDMETAAIKAVYESVSARPGFRIKALTEHIPPIRFDEIQNETDRGHYWYPAQRIQELDFFLDSNETVKIPPADPVEDKYRTAVSMMKKRGYTPIAVDISPPGLNNVAKVVKTIVPELHPFYLNESFKMLKSVHAGSLPDLDLPPHPFL